MKAPLCQRYMEGGFRLKNLAWDQRETQEALNQWVVPVSNLSERDSGPTRDLPQPILAILSSKPTSTSPCASSPPPPFSDLSCCLKYNPTMVPQLSLVSACTSKCPSVDQATGRWIERKRSISIFSNQAPLDRAKPGDILTSSALQPDHWHSGWGCVTCSLYTVQYSHLSH